MAASFAHVTVIKHSTRSAFIRQLHRCTARLQHSLSDRESQIDSYQSKTIVYDENVKYPAIKPKYPPGQWGKMDKNYAWLWNSAAETQRKIPDIGGRINALVEKETSAIVLDQLNDHPATLGFRQYVTKTEIMKWQDLSLYESTLSESEAHQMVISQLKQDICEFLLMEKEFVNRNGKQEQNQLCQTLVRFISDSLIARLGHQFPHLKTSQYDENVLVRSLWSRSGIERKRRRFTLDPDVYLYDTVQDQRIISEGNFQAMLRSHLPLPQCVPRDEGVSVNSAPPQLKFKPTAYGHKMELKKKIGNIIAGHKPGDPCEFGLVGVLSTCDSHSVEERIGAQSARDCRLAQGLTMTFSWLAAQAINQGFSHLNDLTYPLTSQTVLTDGRVFSFLVSQLNTLDLWRDDEANSMVNLCWHSDEMPLYHSVEDGKVNEFNEEVLWTLLKMFTLEPAERGYDMKPTVERTPEDHSSKRDFVPKRVVVEEIVEEEEYIVS